MTNPPPSRDPGEIAEMLDEARNVLTRQNGLLSIVSAEKALATIEAHYQAELDRLTRDNQRLDGELRSVDALLARRVALDAEPTRYAKIEKAISVARQADALTAERDTLQAAQLDVFKAGWAAAISVTNRFGEQLSTPDMEWADYQAALVASPAPEKPHD